MSTQRVKKEPSLFAQVVKTGIIKSNLIPLFAGAMMALYRIDAPFSQYIYELFFAGVGSALIIGAAGAFNNLYDADIDAIMERTKRRPTVTGEFSNRAVWTIGLSFTALGALSLYFASPLAMMLGLFGLFLYVFPYTMWTKRHTIWNTEVGALSGAMPPLIGWTAMTNDVNDLALWALFIIMVLWQMPHFYAIAVRKHDDYKAAHVPMLPVAKGMTRTYKQTQFYLSLLVLSSFLFVPISIFLTIVALVLALIWWYMSYTSYRRKDAYGWATVLFFYSLIHLTILFTIIIGYAAIQLWIA